MARQRTTIPLNVFINGRQVGVLQRASSGAIDFRYTREWLEWKHTFPISLSLPLREDRYLGDQVISVFDNLLPDNDEIRRRVAVTTGSAGTDPYSLLSAIGRDCVGALQFLPDGTEPGPAGDCRGEELSASRIAQLLKDLAYSPLGISSDNDFRISLAGAQEKTALSCWDHHWHLPEGSTATTHILKPQIGIRGEYDLSRSVENEYFCLQLLGAMGLPVAATSIQDFEDQRVLVIERFDRHWTQDRRLLRLPQEDCCQALSIPPARKYESEGGPGVSDILGLLKASDNPGEDQKQFLKAQILFWIIGAIDGHGKNFSLFLHPGGGFSLTPLYDVMSVQPLFDARQLRRNQVKLSMAVGNNRHYRLHDILPRHYYQSAKRAGVAQSVVTSILDEIQIELMSAIDKVSNELPRDFPENIKQSIVEGVHSRVCLIQ